MTKEVLLLIWLCTLNVAKLHIRPTVRALYTEVHKRGQAIYYSVPQVVLHNRGTYLTTSQVYWGFKPSIKWHTAPRIATTLFQENPLQLQAVFSHLQRTRQTLKSSHKFLAQLMTNMHRRINTACAAEGATLAKCIFIYLFQNPAFAQEPCSGRDVITFAIFS